MEFAQKDIDRFWSHVDKKDDDECWGCDFKSHCNGYSRIRINTQQFLAHRLALFLHTKDLPSFVNRWVLACHTCKQNRKCCNPKHLYWGTYQSNSNDRKRDKTFIPNPVKGIKHGRSKITEKQVLEIRDKYAKEGISQQALGTEYALNQTMISHIILRKNWKHI